MKWLLVFILSWPEVVGKSFEEAKKIILTDRPDCHVVDIKPVCILRILSYRVLL